MAYKAINTLDSMIGHTDERYLYFGKVAARLDDVANFLPSRLTALGITAAAAIVDGATAATALDT
jgi:adenosylcobinamide-phosphate synthase